MLSWMVMFICLMAKFANAQSWTLTGNLTTARYSHTATLLPNGNVLVAAGDNYPSGALYSAELYSAITSVWTATGSLNTARYDHTATLLPNGNVLVAAGTPNAASGLNSAELYNPLTGVWTATGSLTQARFYHTAALLPNGNVLVAGGRNSATLAAAEVYNATTGVWTETGSLTYARSQHSATLLPNGNVLVAGGAGSEYFNTAELYNASTGVWTLTGSLTNAHVYHTATLLLNGNVLVAGGYNPSATNSAELYNPTTGVWTVTGSLTYARFEHTATLLPNGNVLVAGGYNPFLNSAELYNPTTGVWTMTGSLTYARDQHTATLLPNGNVLVAGGDGTTSLDIAEVYNLEISFVLNDFSQASLNANGGLTFNGAAAVADGTLTQNVTGQSGSIYFNTSIPTTDTSFTVSFHVQIDMSNCYNGPSGCGDGLAFVIQNTPEGSSFLPTYNSSNYYGDYGSEGLPSGFIIAFQASGDEIIAILPAGFSNAINDNSPLSFDTGPTLVDHYINATYTDYNKNLNVIYSSNINTTPQAVYNGTFDLYGPQALQSITSYYVGFSAGTDSGNRSPEGHKLISVAFQACPAVDTPCLIPTSPNLPPPIPTPTPTSTPTSTPTPTPTSTSTSTPTPTPTTPAPPTFPPTTPTPTPIVIYCNATTWLNASLSTTPAGSVASGPCVSGYVGTAQVNCSVTGSFSSVANVPCVAVPPPPPIATAGCANAITISLPTSIQTSAQSSQVSIAGNLFIDSCFALTSPVVVTWSLTPSIQSVSKFVSSTQSVILNVPSSLLPVGTYTVSVLAVGTASNNNIQNATASTLLNVNALPLVAVLTPASTFRAVQFGQNFTLDASSSYDPNVGVSGAVSCQWSCPNVTLNSGCVIVINGLLLSADSEYTFIVTISKTSYTDVQSQVIIQTVGSIAASVSVVASFVSASGVVPIQQPLRLSSTITVPNSVPSGTTFAYAWSCTSDITACPDLTNYTNVVASKPNSNNLVIQANVLKPGTTYTFTLQLSASNPPVVGTGQIVVKANTPPSNGAFAVNPTQGIQFQTTFTFLMGSWSDVDGGQLTYTFVQRTSSGSLNFLLIAPQSSPQIYVSTLPVGVYDVNGIVYDDTGDMSLGVSVTLNVTSNITSIAALAQITTQQLQQAQQSQDPSVILQIVSAVAQLLASSTNGDYTTAQVLTLQLSQATLQAAQLQTLSSDNVVSLVQVLDLVAANPLTLSSDALSVILNLTSLFASLAGSAANQFLSIINSITAAQQAATVAAQENQTATIQSNIRNLTFSILSQVICDEVAAYASAGDYQLAAQLLSTLGGTALAPSNYSSLSLADQFELGSSGCTQLHSLSQQNNPFSYVDANASLPVNVTSLTVNGSVFTIEFYDGASLDLISVSDLSSSQLITITIATPTVDATNDSVACIFFDVELQQWSSDGCTKSSQTTPSELICECSHATSFSVGVIQLEINTLQISNTIDFGRVGVRAAAITVAVIFFIYIVFLIYTALDDRLLMMNASEPEEKAVMAFARKYALLYSRPISSRVLDTMHLDVWIDAYGTNQYPEDFVFTRWKRFLMDLRYGFRYSHAYIAPFFAPTHTGLRSARWTATVTSLYVSLVITATFFQYGESGSQLTGSDESTTAYILGRRLLAGIITSFITFFPFLLINFLLRRVARPSLMAHRANRKTLEKTRLKGDVDPNQDRRKSWIMMASFSQPSAAGSDVQPVKIALFNTTFLDFYVPVWAEYLLVFLCISASIVSIVLSIFYAAEFSDAEAIAWIESFLISLAISIGGLQTLSALFAATATSALGTFGASSATAAMMVGSVIFEQT